MSASANVTKRGYVRGNATKAIDKVKPVLDVGDDQISTDQIVLLRNSLMNYRKQLDDLNEEVQASITDATELDQEIKRCVEYDDNIMVNIEKLNISIQARTQPQPSQADNATAGNLNRTTTSDESQEIRGPSLPKLQITTFDGDPLMWDTFWDDFTGTVHSRSDFTEVTKFKYLKMCLSGDALRVADGFRLTAANYEQVVDVLKERYGDPEVAVFSHFEALLELPQASHDVEQLRSVFDQCETHIRSLVALDMKEETFGPVFVPILLSKLPKFVKVEVHRRNGSNKWSLAGLRAILKDEIEARSKAERTFGGKSKNAGNGNAPSATVSNWKAGNPGKPQPKSKSRQSTTSALVSPASAKEKMHCAFCDGQHYSDRCNKYSDNQSRFAQLERSKCACCLQSGHKKWKCPDRKPCYYCGKDNHHRSLCRDQFPVQSHGSSQGARAGSQLSPKAQPFKPRTVTAETVSADVVSMRTYLETALVNAQGERKVSQTRLMFDTGATRTFISKQKADEIGAKFVREEVMSVGRFNESKRKTVSRKIVEFGVHLLSGEVKTIEAGVVDAISSAVQLYPLEVEDVTLHSTLRFAEPRLLVPVSATVDVLVGLDYYHDFISDHRIRCPNGLVLQSSSVGYIASGRTSGEIGDENKVDGMFTFATTPEETDLERFWNIEDIGIKDSPVIKDDEIALQRFNDSVKFSNNRYQVNWPYRTEKPDLKPHTQLADGRLKSLYRRLKDNPELLQQYDKIIADQLEKKITEVAPEKPDGIVHHIPHHAVYTPSKTTTKHRVVYDASAKTSKSDLSINDCLYRGPVILQDLVGLHLRFRLSRIAMVSDIEKAFLQIGLQVESRDVTRFKWLKDITKPPTADNVVTYRFTRVPFGFVSSSFLLGACILHLLRQVGTETAKKVERNLYVDNVLGGEETVPDCQQYYNEAVNIFRSGSMNLREWQSNSSEFMALLPEHHRGVEESTKFLGLDWDTKADTFSCSVGAIDSEVKTKRQVLKALASVYDPCGLFTPATIGAKILMQDLWKKGLSWDQQLSEDLLDRWKKCQVSMVQVRECRIPRQLSQSVYDIGAKVELHVFCDASQSAFSAVVYIRIENDSNCTTDLMISKSRVSPAKEKLTIPRLELLAILIGCRLLRMAAKELRLDIAKETIWSDSVCALRWIMQEKPDTVFVRNRVKEIKERSPNVSFRYIGTAENPADLATRESSGIDVSRSTLWWFGPSWLSKPSEEWPAPILPEYVAPANIVEQVSDVACTTSSSTTTDSSSKLVDIERFSNLIRLHRATAYVLRGVDLLRNKVKGGEITADDVARAKTWWVRQVQMDGFPELLSGSMEKKWQNFRNQLSVVIDEKDGLLRCKGRLQHGVPYEANCPLLLPKNHRYTALVIRYCHLEVFHSKTPATLAKVRETYWIPQGWSTVKRIVSGCYRCFRFDRLAYQALAMPDLPDFRVQQGRPFGCIGLDYAGPLFVQGDSKTKQWICLYTCAATRAVHLDLIASLSAKDFLLCLRRFAAIYGIPAVIVSDNAKQFHASDRLFQRLWRESLMSSEVQQYSANKGIRWKFIPELAPWMGGFYERLVKPVKEALKRTVNRRCLSQVELLTVVTEIASVLNSRPLLYLSDEITDDALTPNHFLMRAPHQWPSVEDEDEFRIVKESQLIHGWKRVQSVIEKCWQVWKSQYLLSLREQWRKVTSPRKGEILPCVGTVVQVADKGPRGFWRIGKLIKLNASADGKIRTADVKLGNGNVIRRALQLLYPLEVSASTPSQVAEASTPSQAIEVKSNESAQSRRRPVEKAQPSKDESVQRRRRPQRQAAIRASEAFQQQMAAEEEECEY